MDHHSSKTLHPPREVEAVFLEFRTCEMFTLARDGTPITWPTLPFWYPDEGRFLITTSIGLPHKAFNVRRNPRVSLLFSDPTASGLTNPPAVLVQGDAVSPDEVETSLLGFEDELRQVLRRQPAGDLQQQPDHALPLRLVLHTADDPRHAASHPVVARRRLRAGAARGGGAPCGGMRWSDIYRTSRASCRRA
jgi:Pyridoxamine 5'-phosphate oxidase